MRSPLHHTMSVEEVLGATAGRLVGGGRGTQFWGICTDSRLIGAGDLFVALVGERFDGHAFIGTAVEKGAAGAMVSRVDAVPAGIPLIIVMDTLKALGDLASFWRRRVSVPVLAVTGSSGKTTTKEMAAAILSQWGPVCRTEGNLNNLIGLPLTLFTLYEGHKSAVLEMGTNRPGEIARLTDIAVPTVAVITNVGPAHLEGLGNMEGVFREKTDLFRHTPEGGTVVINNDDPLLKTYREDRGLRRVTFGLDAGGEVTASKVTWHGKQGVAFTLSVGEETTEVFMSVVGRHQLMNALAAVASTWSSGANVDEICKGLQAFRPVSGRMEIKTLSNGAVLIDDTYNANPASVGAAIMTLADLKGSGRGIAVLGDMLELGDEAEKWHQDIGELLADTGVDMVFLRGKLSRATAAGAIRRGMGAERIHIIEVPEDMVRSVSSRLSPGDWVLVKGSRRMAMNIIARGIEEQAGRGGDE